MRRLECMLKKALAHAWPQGIRVSLVKNKDSKVCIIFYSLFFCSWLGFHVYQYSRDIIRVCASAACRCWFSPPIDSESYKKQQTRLRKRHYASEYVCDRCGPVI